MSSSFRPPTAASDSYESPAARCLGILDRAIARGSGCERLINAFGGPQGVRAACARHGITFPAQSAENKPQDWARIPTLRAQWLIALESGQRLERVACNLVRTVWEPLVRPLVNLGYFKRPARCDRANG
jgi:hypothetical protein